MSFGKECDIQEILLFIYLLAQEELIESLLLNCFPIMTLKGTKQNHDPHRVIVKGNMKPVTEINYKLFGDKCYGEWNWILNDSCGKASLKRIHLIKHQGTWIESLGGGVGRRFQEKWKMSLKELRFRYVWNVQEAVRRSVLLAQRKDWIVPGKSQWGSWAQAAAACILNWAVMTEEHVAHSLLSPSCDFKRNGLVRRVKQESLVEMGV